uniref:Ig-like domain repeat protein n=1 Tax=Methanobrevibacter sp. TaxID=66852 RepID=UPI00388D6DAF
PASDSTTVDVPKIDDYSITIDLDGDDEIVVELPEDATGNVTVSIDGKEQVVPVEDGKAVVDLSGLEPGKHAVEVTYSGDDKYAKASNATVVEIPKVDDYEITVDAVVDGNSVDITVTLPGDITGPVLIDVDGVGYYANATGGQAKLHLDDLSKGDYNVVVTYPGDDKYTSNGNTTSFTIDEKETPVNIEIGDDEIVIELPEDATGNVTVSIDGKNQTVPVKGGKAVVDISGLEPGQHTVDVKYSGDDNYGPASNSTVFEVPKIDDYPVTIDLNGDDLVVNVPEDATGDVIVTIDGKEQVVPVKDGKAVVDISGLEPGNHTVEVTYTGDDKYAKASNATIVEIPKIPDYPFDVNAEDIKVGDRTNITINLPEDINGPVLVDIDGIGYYVNVTDGVAHVDLPINLKPGSYDVVVTFPGNDKYESKTVKDTFIVYEKETPISIEVGDDEIVIELPEDATGDVKVSIDGKEQTVPVKDGKAVVDISGLEPGNHTVVVNYPGDSQYPPASNSTTFEVPKIDDYSIDINKDGNNLVVTVPGDATGDVVVNIAGKDYTVPIKDGKAVVDISGLEPGDYPVVVNYAGDDKYAPASNSTTVNVPKIDDYSINVTEDGNNLVVNVPSDATGDVIVNIGGKDYTVPIKEGKAVVDISGLPTGSYDAKVTYPGNDKYASKTIDAIINKTRSLVITAPDVIKYYSGPERFIVYLRDDSGNNLSGLEIKITINGVTYTRTSQDGRTSMALNLESGNYTVKVEFAGDSEFKPQTLTSHVEILPTIYANDVLKVFRNGTQYYALFLDGEGNPLKDTDVSFNIHGVFYTRTTNATGWAKLNINLEQGEYILTATNPVTGEMKSNKITVFTLIESSDLTKHFRNDSQFIIRVRGADGNWAKAGEEVTFNIHGVFYTRTTNETGHVKLNINIEPGEYIITTYYKDCAESNIIKVLPRLVTSDLVMKYGDGSAFVAKTLDEQGNPYPHQEVSFNLFGILYTRTTNDQAEARININLPVGDYSITSYYDFGNGVETESNKIKIEA